jgi:hypothetical protein
MDPFMGASVFQSFRIERHAISFLVFSVQFSVFSSCLAAVALVKGQFDHAGGLGAAAEIDL